jgi:hypothetical protein
VHEFARVSGRTPVTIYQRFGSWGAFREAAGLPRRAKRGYSAAELLEKGRAAYEAIGCNMGAHDFERHSGVSPTTVIRHFGSWAEFRAQVGHPRNPGNPKLRRYTREGILASLRRTVERVGETLTLKEFLQRTGLPGPTFYRHFMTWPEARECVDLPGHVKKRTRYTDEFLLGDLHDVAVQLRRTPRREDYEAYGKASVETLLKRYGPEWKDVQDRYARFVEYQRAFPTRTIERRFADLNEEERAREIQRAMEELDRVDRERWEREEAIQPKDGQATS